MLTIGLLGGMSWESSAEYYRLINREVQTRLGGVHSAPVVLNSVDFAEIERLQAKERWREAGHLLGTHAAALEAAGADVLVLCTNTMHKVLDQIQAAVRIPAIHIADPTARAIRREGLHRVGLLGTAFTMEQDFYRDRLADAGVQALIPKAASRQTVHRVIYDELVRGVVNPRSRAAYVEIINELIDAGAEGVILGCTEIELLIRPEDSPVPVFPTTALHALAAVDHAIQGR